MAIEKLPVPEIVLNTQDVGSIFQTKMNAAIEALRFAIIAYNNQVDAANTSGQQVAQMDSLIQQVELDSNSAIVQVLTSTEPEVEVEFGGQTQLVVPYGYLKELAEGEVASAAAYANASAVSAEASRTLANLFSTIEAGLAAVSEGEYFQIPSSNTAGFADLYQRINGVAAFVKSYPSAASLAAVRDDFDSVFKQPDEQFDLRNDILVTLTDKSGRRTWLEANSVNGKPTDYAAKIVYDTVLDKLPAKIVDIYTPDVLVAVTDKSGLRTWLEANSKDGKPTNYAAKVLYDTVLEKLPADIAEQSVLDTLVTITDRSGRMTELTVRADGSVPDWVIYRWANRLKTVIDIEPATQAPSYFYGNNYPTSVPTALRNDVYNRNGEMLPVYPNMQRIVLLGSSSAQGLNTSLQSWCNAKNVTLTSLAKGREWSIHNAARLGAIPFLLTFPGNIIPAFGSVTVQASNFDVPISSKDALLAYQGTVAGIQGQLSVLADGANLVFTRLETGTAINVDPDVAFLPDAAHEVRNDVYVFWLGKNDCSGSPPGSAPAIIKRLDQIYNWMAPLYPRGIVLGNFINGNWLPGNHLRDTLDAVNRYKSARFTNRYIDIQAWIESPQLWIDTGISPTNEDLLAQSERRLPPSVRQDNGHFTSSVLAVITNTLISNKFTQLGWY